MFERDGWGFLLRATEPGEPDWDGLGRAAERLLDEIRSQRAAA